MKILCVTQKILKHSWNLNSIYSHGIPAYLAITFYLVCVCLMTKWSHYPKGKNGQAKHNASVYMNHNSHKKIDKLKPRIH